MQFEVNLNACSSSACEMEQIEKRIKKEYERLFKVYSFLASSDNISNRELAKKIRKELTAIESEIQKITVFRKSLEKIIDLYKNSERYTLFKLEFTNNRFILPINPIPPKPIPIINYLIPNLNFVFFTNDKSGG